MLYQGSVFPSSLSFAQGRERGPSDYNWKSDTQVVDINYIYSEGGQNISKMKVLEKENAQVNLLKPE